jgi:squalene-hopene/tetraprenyl-beta-curcumene cyclase
LWRDIEPARIERAIRQGLAYLERVQGADGRWVPLWFGNENEPGEENPIYGTARVLLAYRDLGFLSSKPARRGMAWLAARRNADGGWGGDLKNVSGVEETAVAVEALLDGTETPSVQVAAEKGLAWIVEAVETGRHHEAAAIGFYFARLWYHEMMYPLVFSLSALTRAVQHFGDAKGD